MKVLTTLFLFFGMGSFIYFAYEKRKDACNLIGDIVSAIFMMSAIYFMWG